MFHIIGLPFWTKIQLQHNGCIDWVEINHSGAGTGILLDNKKISTVTIDDFTPYVTRLSAATI